MMVVAYLILKAPAELGLLYSLDKKKLQHIYMGLHKKLQAKILIQSKEII